MRDFLLNDVKICPELLAKMTIPRKSAELVNNIVTDISGNNVDSDYRFAVELAMKQIENQHIDFAILQSRSPTCGVNTVYDGSFSGRLVKGQGLFAEALINAGYKVIDVEDYEKISQMSGFPSLQHLSIYYQHQK